MSHAETFPKRANAKKKRRTFNEKGGKENSDAKSWRQMQGCEENKKNKKRQESSNGKANRKKQNRIPNRQELTKNYLTTDLHEGKMPKIQRFTETPTILMSKIR